MDVSVIIPTYNRLWSLPRAIESCRHTKCKTQIIVVDDGSTDGTWDWLVTQKDLVSIYQPNQGQTYAINNAFKSATGKYIRFLDSDDFLENEIIDRQFELAEKENLDIVVSNVADYDHDSASILKKNDDLLFWEDFMEVQLSPRYGSHFLGMLFKKQMADNMASLRRPDFANREDRMFLLEFALLNPKVGYLPVTGGYWVKHSTQMQANYQGMKSVATNWQHLNIYKKIVNALEKDGKLTTARKKAVSGSLWILAHWIAKTHIKEATDVYKWILELDPEFKIPEKGIMGWMYKNLGFKTTEKILAIRRFIKYGFN